MILTLDWVWWGLKWVYVVGFALYVGFSVVMVSQVKQMTNTLSGGVEKQATWLAWAHLAVSVLALVWAIVVI